MRGQQIGKQIPRGKYSFHKHGVEDEICVIIPLKVGCVEVGVWSVLIQKGPKDGALYSQD